MKVVLLITLALLVFVVTVVSVIAMDILLAPRMAMISFVAIRMTFLVVGSLATAWLVREAME